MLEVKCARACSIIFEQACYCAPFRLVSQRLWGRGGSQEVRIDTRHYELVATHARAPRAGARD